MGRVRARAHDAIRERIRMCEDLNEETELKENLRIDVLIEAGSMFIFDNALGMDYETLNEYRKIGFSRKPYGEYAGWRGIGKAAGLAVSEKLLVTTSTGNGKTHLLTFDARKMIDEIKDLRSKGENIPFNKLIEKYSIIKSSDGGARARAFMTLISSLNCHTSSESFQMNRGRCIR